ncbi:MAG TPA: hypothetical protein VF708_08780 [Pyrinomonadaceae bacterium]|jgi:hypothetical protein
MKNIIRSSSIVRLLVLVALLIGVPSVAWAQNVNQWWSTVATTGEVDESNQAVIDYNGPFATIKPAAPNPTTVVLRYQVSPVDGLFFAGCKQLRVRYRDDGPGATVKVALRRTDIIAGGTITHLTFDSNLFPQAAGFQTQIGPCANFVFDWTRYSYWIEVSMVKTLNQNTPGLPGLQVVQIIPD